MLALTGGTGFIGGAIARHLSASGWRIRALVRSAQRSQALSSLGADLVVGQLAERKALARLVQGVDAVVHCAGAVRGRRRADFDTVNVEGVARLAEAALQEEPARGFLLLSSLAARAPHLSQYAASKRQGEVALCRIAGDVMKWTVLRPPAVYGPGDRELLPLLRCMALGFSPRLGPPRARFSMLYVEDLAAAIQAWLAVGSAPSGVFELHDGHANGYSWDEVADIAAALCRGRSYSVQVPRSVLQALARMSVFLSGISGQAPMLSPGKVRELTHPDWVCDNDAFVRATGWAPEVQFREGVERTLRSVGQRAID